MKGKIVVTLSAILFAFAILSVSILRSAEGKISYSPMVLSESTQKDEIYIDYVLAYQGKVNPDNFLWYLKVVRDRVWYLFTFNKDKKVELNMLFADKRLSSALELFKSNKPDLGLTTLTKAEKYLLIASEVGTDNMDINKKLALSSLKHREVIENEILKESPEDLKPDVIKTGDYSKDVYKKVRDFMLSKGWVPPQNPFEMK